MGYAGSGCYSLLTELGIVYIRNRNSNSNWHKLADKADSNLYVICVYQRSYIDSPRALRAKEYSTLRMWHSRLGHKDFRVVGAMMNLSVPRNPPVCAACQQGKLKATPHPRVPERTSNVFDLAHADLVPLDGVSFGGSNAPIHRIAHGLVGHTFLP
jgi:GAG-pre-integrase domain